MYGDGKGHSLTIHVTDAEREQHYVGSTAGSAITWTGWKVLWFDLSRRENRSSWGGDKNHTLDPPLRAHSIVLDDKPDSFRGESDLYFADIMFLTHEMKPQYEDETLPHTAQEIVLPTAGEFVTSCPNLGQAPKLDGTLDDTAWKMAATLPPLLTTDGKKPKRATRARVGHHQGILYAAFECTEPDAAKLKAKHLGHDTRVYEDECVEVFLSPTPGGRRYFHFMVNSAGARCDEARGPGSKGVAWNASWQAATAATSSAWHVEFAVPLKSVRVSPALGASVGLNLNRANHSVPELSCWRPTGPSFHQPDRFGELVFGELPAFVSRATLPGLALGSNDVVMEVHNRSGQAVTVLPAVEAGVGKSVRLFSGGQTSIEPKGKAWATVRFELPSEGDAALRVVLKDGGGRLFRRSRLCPLRIEPVTQKLAAMRESLAVSAKGLASLRLSEQTRKALETRCAELQRRIEEFTTRRDAPETRLSGQRARLARDISAIMGPSLNRFALAVETYMHAGEGAPQMPPLDYCLSSADTMVKVFRDEPWAGRPAKKLSIEAARNEVEGVQLVVVPLRERDIRFATVEVTDLESEQGATISRANVTWHVVGYVKFEKPARGKHKTLWWPDPLLSQRHFHVEADQVQPIWLNVHVPMNAKAGLYRGTVTVRPAAQHELSIPLEVRVWNFAVPKQQHMETCFPVRPKNLQRFYKLPHVPIELYEKWLDFCLDHRISANLCDWGQFDEDMERLVERQLGRGGSAFCLAYAWFSKGKPKARQEHNAKKVAQIKQLYDRAKRRGWIKRAYIYCHDEIGKEQFEFAHELYRELKKAMPDLRLMQTFYKDDPIPALDDVLDIWAPVTGRYRKDEFQTQQAKGDEVWWYVCCGPGKPFANLMIPWPAIDHRILLWQNWKFNVSGFLYWGLTVWRDNLKGEARWPDAPWNPATWRNSAGVAHYGDGQLIYPGPDLEPLSSIRLENLRDGIEDYEYFWLLRDAVARLGKSGRGHKRLLDQARKALTIDDSLVKDLKRFTHDPAALREARASVARLIERVRAALAGNP